MEFGVGVFLALVFFRGEFFFSSLGLEFFKEFVWSCFVENRIRIDRVSDWSSFKVFFRISPWFLYYRITHKILGRS